MITRTFVLSGAASLAVAAAITAAPSFARDEYSRVSTPVERAQTEDLNRTAVAGSVVGTDQENYDAARARYEEAQANYNRQLDDYNAKARAYNAQRRNYREDVEASQDRAEAYDDARTQYEREFVPPVGARASLDQLWTVDRVRSSELYNLPVEDIDGFMQGHFRRVEIRANGERMAVITLNSQRTIAIPAQEVRYDPARGVVVAEWTGRDLDRVPPG